MCSGPTSRTTTNWSWSDHISKISPAVDGALCCSTRRITACAKGLARYVAHNDAWVDLSPQYPSINTCMDRTIGSHDYRAISIPENRWIVPGARGSRGAYDFGIYPCDEVCVTSDGGHNKLLMDTERVDGYQVHVIIVPAQNDTTVRKPPSDEIRLNWGKTTECI